MEVSGSGVKEARRSENLSGVARDRSQRALWALLAFALCQMRDFGGSEQRQGMTCFRGTSSCRAGNRLGGREEDGWKCPVGSWVCESGH